MLTWLVNTPPPQAVQSPKATGLPWVGEVSGGAGIEWALENEQL